MKLITPLLRIQNQLRVFHWQTTSYAQHKAFGKAYEELDELFDTFVEVFTGKYGRSKASLHYTIELDNLDDNFLNVIDSYVEFMKDLDNQLDIKDTDLLNIRDEILGVLNRLKYLLSLK